MKVLGWYIDQKVSKQKYPQYPYSPNIIKMKILILYPSGIKNKRPHQSNTGPTLTSQVANIFQPLAATVTSRTWNQKATCATEILIFLSKGIPQDQWKGAASTHKHGLANQGYLSLVLHCSAPPNHHKKVQNRTSSKSHWGLLEVLVAIPSPITYC